MRLWGEGFLNTDLPHEIKKYIVCTLSSGNAQSVLCWILLEECCISVASPIWPCRPDFHFHLQNRTGFHVFIHCQDNDSVKYLYSYSSEVILLYIHFLNGIWGLKIFLGLFCLCDVMCIAFFYVLFANYFLLTIWNYFFSSLDSLFVCLG